MLTDTMSNGLWYPLGPAWARIFVDLQRLVSAGSGLAEGVYPLAGGLENGGAQATVSIYTTKPHADGLYESHRAMADIQLVLEGEEFIDIVPLEGLTPSKPYDAEADIVFYSEKPAAAVRTRLTPGNFALVPPQDAHMPSLCVQMPSRVKKVVVKLPASLLEGADSR